MAFSSTLGLRLHKSQLLQNDYLEGNGHHPPQGPSKGFLPIFLGTKESVLRLVGPRACSVNTQASGSVPNPAPTPNSLTYQPSSFVPHRVPCSRHFQGPSLGLLQCLLGLRQSPEHQKGPHSLLELLTVGRE